VHTHTHTHTQNPISLSLSVSLSLTHTHTQINTQIHTLRHRRPQRAIPTRQHIILSLTLTHSHTHTRTQTHTPRHRRPQRAIPTRQHIHTHNKTSHNSLFLTLSLTHTHTRTRTHKHTHYDTGDHRAPNQRDSTTLAPPTPPQPDRVSHPHSPSLFPSPALEFAHKLLWRNSVEEVWKERYGSRKRWGLVKGGWEERGLDRV